MRVLVFGDSIAYGAWDSRGGWVDRLKAKAHEFTLKDQDNNKLQIINLGIGGDTSTKILRRMGQEIEARHSPAWPFVFVVAIGTNDSRQLPDGEREVPEQSFRENIVGIVELARKNNGQVLFVGLPPLPKPRVDFKNLRYSNEVINQYDKILEEIARAESIGYIPISMRFANDAGNYFNKDSLHPNDKGHELILGAVLPEIEKICGVKL
jgi:lysophospholipase L1-like esterase